MSMRIDVWSDVVCPWCYLGSARLAQAIEQFEHRDQVEVVYRSYELDPGFPRNAAEPALPMLMRKYRLSAEQAAAADDRVASLARAEGLPYDPGHVVGNTFDVHRVLHLAREHNRQLEVLHTLFRSAFGSDSSIFEPEALVALAATAGVDGADVRRVLNTDEYTEAVRDDEQQAREIGITGVPFFLFDGRLYVEGAQPTDVMKQALAQAWEQQ